MRHRHLPKSIAPSRWVTIGLWIATAVIVILMGYYITEQLLKLT
jgi:hypothetical protein